jgi:hypothetical protein
VEAVPTFLLAQLIIEMTLDFVMISKKSLLTHLLISLSNYLPLFVSGWKIELD